MVVSIPDPYRPEVGVYLSHSDLAEQQPFPLLDLEESAYWHEQFGALGRTAPKV